MLPDLDYSNPFGSVRYMFRIFGCVLSLAASVIQITYYLKSEFTSRFLYDIFSICIVAKFVIFALLSVFVLLKNTLLRKNDIITLDESIDLGTKEQKPITIKETILFYASLPLALPFGLYRLYSPKDFRVLIPVSYIIDLFVQTIPCLWIITSTNSALDLDYLDNL